MNRKKNNYRKKIALPHRPVRWHGADQQCKNPEKKANNRTKTLLQEIMTKTFPNLGFFFLKKKKE